MLKEIKTKDAPVPQGPYSQAILIDHFLFVSGQIGIDPYTLQSISDSIENETKQVFENLKAILKAANASFANVIKVEIYIKNISDFNEVNKIYSEYFNDLPQPARTTVEVSNLPKDANIEISLISYIK
jgi:2-iminobutanoate/2-iminopropanoate deaminase